MASHLSTLGFVTKTSEDFYHLAMQAARAGKRVEVPGQGSYIVWNPGERIELWAQIDQRGQLIGLNPHFRSEAVMQVGLTKRVSRPDDTALDGAFYGWAGAPENDPEMGTYPFAFDVPDYRTYDGSVLPLVASVHLTAFAHQMSAYENEDVFSASESHMAIESCIPSGTFLPGPQGGPIDPPKSEVIYNGRVLETARLTNPSTHLSFHWARVRTLGGEVEVVAHPEVVKGSLVKDGIIGGAFWLSGQLR